MGSDRLDLYKILGVSQDATATKIKTAFRALARKHHPDKNKNSLESTALFQTILNAYSVLSDPAARSTYDSSLPPTKSGLEARPSSKKSATEIVLRPADSAHTASLVLNHLNVILWDLEELLHTARASAPKAESEALRGFIVMMLTFIDKWVLDAAGFPDYFFQARGIEPTEKAGGTPTLPYENLPASHRPYTDVEDYFYDIRKRTDRLLNRARLVDLFGRIAGTSVRVIDSVFEAHNYCMHYLGWLKRAEEEGVEKIPPFHHSNPVFERSHP